MSRPLQVPCTGSVTSLKAPWALPVPCVPETSKPSQTDWSMYSRVRTRSNAIPIRTGSFASA